MVQALSGRVATGIAKNYKMAERAKDAAMSGGMGWTASGLYSTGLMLGGHPIIGGTGVVCAIHQAISNFKDVKHFKKIMKKLEPEYQKIVDRARQIYKK